MDKPLANQPSFIVEGGRKLSGSIMPSGNKNAALPIIAACLLTKEKVTLQNIPDIADVRNMLAIAAGLGVSVKKIEAHSYEIEAKDIDGKNPDPELSRKIRASFLFAAPLIARRGEAILKIPGGDLIGRRTLSAHEAPLKELGATITREDDSYHIRAKNKDKKLIGANIFLPEASVTGTEQAVMAAVLAKGETLIENAACEPHVQDLCKFLNKLGAKISGIGTNAISIKGVAKLSGGTYRIGTDFMEVVSLISLAAATGSELTILDAEPENHRMTKIQFAKLGIRFEVKNNKDIFVPAKQEMTIKDGAIGEKEVMIESMTWPGFNPDLISPTIVAATQCSGAVIFHERFFDRRLFFVDSLRSMGAHIIMCDPHRAIVYGRNKLRGIPTGIPTPDIRAGMAMLIAALAAKGKTVLHNIGQIDRGYERMDERLNALGARIERVG